MKIIQNINLLFIFKCNENILKHSLKLHHIMLYSGKYVDQNMDVTFQHVM